MGANLCPPSQCSLTDTEFAISDRRASPRFRTVCFDVKLDRGSRVGLFRARNISDAGMMLHTHVTIDVGEHVVVGLADGLAFRGTVLWCSERCCGIRFERPIDCVALLRAEAEHKRFDRRGGAMRLAAMTRATCYAEHGIRPIKVVDASHRGMGLVHDGSLRTGMLLKLVVESGIERNGAVRWSADGRAGIRLMEPLTCEELDRVNLDCRAGGAAARRPEMLLAD